jgi:hypothetical protein
MGPRVGVTLAGRVPALPHYLLDKWDVGGCPSGIAKLGLVQPSQALMIMLIWGSGDVDSVGNEVDDAMVISKPVGADTFSDGRMNPEFFQNFSSQSVLVGFCLFDFATGEFPESPFLPVISPLGSQDTTIPKYDCGHYTKGFHG